MANEIQRIIRLNIFQATPETVSHIYCVNDQNHKEPYHDCDRQGWYNGVDSRGGRLRWLPHIEIES